MQIFNQTEVGIFHSQDFISFKKLPTLCSTIANLAREGDKPK